MTAFKRHAQQDVGTSDKIFNSTAYGLGVAYQADDGLLLSLDYMSYYRNQGRSAGPTRIEGISVTLAQEY